ncbi:hypothetical protein F8O06_05185 [Pseudoclavibacter sp. CFCC 14310]|uniref:hypothetical protein n=1 Tax=Pseudoclavibacter sp. CFCC 14310 TaxID=2615180 RepID=UPI0013019A80|nr:hypothetical protein [Pseudoclavibacter sp. CFCC 14310]KAB1646159.1 hypothetical protein F8O06_05185 [Pseudoclavibacter sp. CFCC 14310]
MRGAPPAAEQIVEKLEAILWSEAAADLQLDRLPANGVIVRLPMFALRPPKMNVGRKALTRQLLHLRLQWRTPVVQVLAVGATFTAEWRTTSLGHGLTGSRTFTADGAIGERYYGRRQLARKVESLRHGGVRARAELLHLFEPFAREQLERANFSLSSEIADFHRRTTAESRQSHSENLLDDTTVEQMVTEMLYGTPERRSDVDRLIDKALAPEALDGCDLDRIFRYGVWSRARSTVQRAIGDPHIGPKIRKLVGKSANLTYAEVIERYRQLYPREHLSWERTVKALSAPLPQGQTFTWAAEVLERQPREAAA